MGARTWTAIAAAILSWWTRAPEALAQCDCSRPAQVETCNCDVGLIDNVLVGPVVGFSFCRGVKQLLIGVEGGVGSGPERLNVGVTRRRMPEANGDEGFAYLELDPWLIVGGSLGIGVGSASGVHPVLGVWEGVPLMDPGGGCGSSDWRMAAAVSIGYRYTGVHEVYLAPKIGSFQPICMGD